MTTPRRELGDLYSPNRSLWRTHSVAVRRKLIHDHASTVFEDVCRACLPGARRHWERDIEIDLVAPDPEDASGLVVGEVKWRRLTAAQRAAVSKDLEKKWRACSLSARHPRVRFVVLDASSLT